MADSTIGKAYVQIIPSAEGITERLNELLGTSSYDAGKSAGVSLGSGLLSALSDIGGKIGDIMKSAVSEVTAFVSDSVSVGADFDSQMSQIAATMGMTSDDIKNNVKLTKDAVMGAGEIFDMLRDKAKEMGADTNFSASQAAEGLNILAMSGYDAESSVEMIGDVLHLAAAGSMDMATSAKDISGAMKGFGDASKSSAYYADLMAKGATLANTNVTQLGEALSGAAAQGSAYKQNADSMTVALLRLAEQGETGANASTMLSAAMKNLYTPTDQAKAALAELGVAAFDSAGNYRDINTVINELNASLKNYSNEQQAAYINTIFGIQGQEAYNKMVVTSTGKQKEWAAALSDSTGEAAKQYDTMTNNLQGDIDKWNSALEGFKIEISDSVMPAVREFVQIGTDGLSKITDAFTENGIEGAVTAFGDLFGDILAKANEMLPDVLNVLVTLSESIVTGFANALPGIADAVTGAIPQLSAAFAKIGDALVKNAPALTDSLGQLFAAVMTSALEMLPGLASGLGEMLVALVNAAAAYIPQIVQAIGAALPQLSAALVGNLPAFLDALEELVGAVIDSLPELLSGLIGAASVIAEAIIGALPDVLQTVVEALPELLTALLDALPLIADAVNNVLLKLGEILPEILPVILPAVTECVVKLIESTADMLTNNIMPLLDTVIEVAKTLAECVIDNIDLFADCVWEVIKAVGKAIYDNAPELEEKLFALIEKLIDYLPELYDDLIKAGGDLIMKLADGFTDIGKNIIGGIWEGIVNKWHELEGNITEWGDSVLETFCDIFDINSPSKVMEKLIGKNLALGIETGFTGEMDDVTKQMGEGVGAVIDELADAELTAAPTVQNAAFSQRLTPEHNIVETDKQNRAPAVLKIVVNGREFAESIVNDINECLGRETIFDMGGYARS